ncbi:MAG: ABC transporter permease [Actinomycetota bacterium]|nr:ABC transporter permease [Actinomycetota bacterium]
MTTVALKGMLGRKFRTVLTGMAIVLGVAMISGTFILTDTINKAFDSIFVSSYKNADAVITGKTVISNSSDVQVTPPSFPESTLAKVRALPDVSAAAGGIIDQARLVDKNGKSITTSGAPNLAFSIDPKEQRFNPLTLKEGEWPQGQEVVIDKESASKHHFRVGDTIRVATHGPAQPYKISGIAELGAVSSIGSTTFAGFDLPTAQRIFNKPGKLDVIRISAKPGVTSKRLAAEIKPLLPASAQVRDVTAQVKEDKKSVGGFLTFIQTMLLAFAGVALFVGAFVIANTLAITVAQRIREFATLRTIGASRKQVLWSVILESFVIGLVASVVGLFLGLGLAKILNRLFVLIGIDLPQSSTVFATRTVVVSLLVGILITLLASLRPAIRATGIPPIAAVREGSVLPRSRLSRFGPTASMVVLALGLALLLIALFMSGLSVATRMLSLGIGTLLLFLGVALVSAHLIRPLASLLGWPASRLGAPGELARENSIRNPSRTASTAAALMIGLALVTFVAVMGAGLRSSFEDAVDQLFVGDYALTARDTFTPLTTEAANRLRDVPGVTAVSGIRAGSGKAFGDTVAVTAVEPNVKKVINFDWDRGSKSVPERLGADGAFVDQDYRKKHHLKLGSPIEFVTPSGKTLHLRLEGVYHKPKGGSPFGDVNFSAATFDANYTSPQNEMALMNIKGGVTDENTKTLENALKSDFPDAKVATQSQFKKDFEKPLNSILNLLYILLALSVVISMFGIINTLVLTVFERTRELGMLRAVGMTRWQTRLMIGFESITTALIGAALGIVIGVFLGYLISTVLSGQGLVFAVPWTSLVMFVLAAILVGIVAAILPAQRAARLNVLEALQYE